MKKARIVLTASFLLTVLGAAPSRAEREDVGRVISMTPSRIVIETVDHDRLRLDVTGKTRMFAEGRSTPVSRLLPDSRVRVSHQNGVARAIFVKAVPK